MIQQKIVSYFQTNKNKKQHTLFEHRIPLEEDKGFKSCPLLLMLNTGNQGVLPQTEKAAPPKNKRLLKTGGCAQNYRLCLYKHKFCAHRKNVQAQKVKML